MNEVVSGYNPEAEAAQKIIGEMPVEQFTKFQNELQYALKWWSHAFQESQTHIAWNDGEQQSPKAYHYYLNGRENILAIAHSPLYDAVRTRIRRDYGVGIPADWAGWFGLPNDQAGDIINQSIQTIFRGELPIRGLLASGMNRSAEKVAAAKEAIEGYGIKGIFVENPTAAGLVTTFNETYEPIPSAEKSALPSPKRTNRMRDLARRFHPKSQ
jgi:hypothetical protein